MHVETPERLPVLLLRLSNTIGLGRRHRQFEQRVERLLKRTHKACAIRLAIGERAHRAPEPLLTDIIPNAVAVWRDGPEPAERDHVRRKCGCREDDLVHESVALVREHFR